MHTYRPKYVRVHNDKAAYISSTM